MPSRISSVFLIRTVPPYHTGGPLVRWIVSLGFSNLETVDWWFEKRKYLLMTIVDGFKTDRGEFILSNDIVAANGCTGLEMRNGYAESYVKAYSRFVGKDRVLFSRAGYKGQQKYPIQWAGDHMSKWEEF